jgi:ATP-dependent DNA helicase RecQ
MQALSILQKVWGYSAFRPLQAEIIESILAKKDTLALLPTGGGKSICFQVPALLQPGLCLVISPLIALMRDQVDQLRKKNITAFAIYAGMDRKEVRTTLITAAESNCKFLYVSPERLETVLFQEYLPALSISLIAVDEAHCISQWGYDFRPSYLRIAALKEQLPGIPVLALTASATPEVQKDICEKLLFGESHRCFRQSFARPNLSYSVFGVDPVLPKLLQILQNVPGSSIVYCRSRKRTEEIASQLVAKGIKADWYHAGLSTNERQKKQEDWQENRLPVMVCTNAFGMGIDKPDVRTVIHCGIPDCLESYYQEAGRAGRDRQKAYAVLLFTKREYDELSGLSDLRFPTLSTIKKVYQALANYLQLPSGTGAGQYYDFELSEFTKRFSLSATTVQYVLKALEQEGWIEYNEQVFIPVRVQIIADRTQLEALATTHPDLDKLCKTLLRTYQGIYERPTGIAEKQVAFLLKKEPDQVAEWLLQLQKMGYIGYQPRKENPQLYFPIDRIKTEDLSLNNERYAARKKQADKSVNSMLYYASEQQQCRSKIVGAYFGDDTLPDCGICDNCLAKKQADLLPEEFAALQAHVLQLLKTRPLSTTALLRQLSSVGKEKARRVIDYLKAEEKISIDASGQIRLR